jgi:hypothetical protein
MTAVLRNKATYELLDNNFGGDVYTLDYNGGNYQKWLFVRQHDDTYVLQNIGTTFVLDYNGSKVHTRNPNRGNSQKWRFYRQNDGSYAVQNLATSVVLDSKGASNADPLDSSVRDNQKWFHE